MDESMSEEIRQRIANSVSALHKDKKYTDNLYYKLKGKVPYNKGSTISDEQKAKIGKARKAAYADPSYVNPNTGTKRTAEQLENLREGYKKRSLPKGLAWTEAHGDQYTPEVREKMRQAKLGKKPANTKQVECIETGQVFNGLTEAGTSLGINRQSIYMQIKGKLKSAGGKHFRYKP